MGIRPKMGDFFSTEDDSRGMFGRAHSIRQIKKI